MTQEEERYYEIGEASYEWVGERGDTEFRCGAEWSDEHPRKGLVDINKAVEWLETNQHGFILTEKDIEDFRKAMEE